jgi:hypothetical protein
LPMHEQSPHRNLFSRTTDPGFSTMATHVRLPD